MKDLIFKVGGILMDCLMLNGQTIELTYTEYGNITARDVLFEMSKNLPRKKKKLVRKYLLV